MEFPNQNSPEQEDLFNLMQILDSTEQSKEARLRKIQAIHQNLPNWFIPMLNDTRRNKFYELMIKNHVHGKTVLEIGAGVGMWGLLAAQYGAKQVYTCELNPLMYLLTKDNIKKSPYSKKIKLFFAHSKSLELKKHIPTKVDIILSELISSDIISEDMVPTLLDAKRLLKPKGIYLPSKISVHGVLIEFEKDIAAKIQSSHPTFKLLNILSMNQSTYINLNQAPFKIISKPISLFILEDGFKSSPELPLQFNIKKISKIKTKNTYLCVYFSMHDGPNKLTNLDIKNKNNNCHWENIVWKLDNKMSDFNLSLNNLDGHMCLMHES